MASENITQQMSTALQGQGRYKSMVSCAQGDDQLGNIFQVTVQTTLDQGSEALRLF